MRSKTQIKAKIVNNLSYTFSLSVIFRNAAVTSNCNI